MNDRKPLFDDFVALTLQKQRLEEELKKIKAQIAEKSEQIKSQFEESGETQVRLTSGVLIYLQKKVFASLKDGVTKEMAIPVLQRLGFGRVIREDYNANTLASAFREMKAEGHDLPEELEGYFNLNPVYEVRMKG